ncbi:MAG: prephenate dehydrogenase [Gemmataceae bacterium]
MNPGLQIPTLAIVGVGLMGGSIALASRRKKLASRIIGFDNRTENLQVALDRGIVDDPAPDLNRLASSASLVVFCAPVDRLADLIGECADACRPGTLLTDVGSTKSNIVRRLAGRLPSGVTYVGSHPLAGSEKNGPTSAREDLFEGKLVVVTPAGESPSAVSTILKFWQALGARVETMSPEQHDEALAVTSHLPHLVASALAGVLPIEWKRLTATGFRDATRLAAGSPELWRAIFQSNRPALLASIRDFREHLDRFFDALQENDGEKLKLLLQQGKYVRESLSDP